MPSVTAIQANHRHLYHYQPYGDDWTGYLETTLRDRSLFLPSPSTFNDPWDCRPWFDLDVLNDANVREQYIEWFMQQAIVPRPKDAEEMRNNPQLLREMVTQCSMGLIDKIDADYRVFCLTPSDDNLLMWSHYARNHKGVCLQFDARAEPIVGAFQVSYQQQLPLSAILELENDGMFNALLTKSDVWEYEEEFRVIAKDHGVASPGVPIAINNRVRIADNALVRIIVGCECVGADEIVDMVRRHQPSVSVRQANRHPHRYGLGFTTVYDGL